jgi:hypothetical protein
MLFDYFSYTGGSIGSQPGLLSLIILILHGKTSKVSGSKSSISTTLPLNLKFVQFFHSRMYF